MADQLTNGAEHLSLEHRFPLPRRGQRESTVESAVQAEGIIDLYGSSSPRDSWPSADPADTSHRRITAGKGVVEELAEPPGSPASWDGPIAALNNGFMSRPSSSSTAPPITVTAPGTPEKGKFPSQRNSSFASSAPASPTYPSIARLSPHHAQARTENSSASTSQISVAGSFQYPGEENDAFRVRSTCE